MDAETTKIGLFVVAFAALLLVGRWLSNRPQDNPFTPSPPPLAPDGLGLGSETLPLPAVGYELPFPPEALKALSDLPPEERPLIVNYYFDKTDLTAGPPNPIDFVDTLRVEHDNPPELPPHRFTISVIVTTPTTLARILREEKRGSIFASRYLIVERFHLGNILAGYLQQLGTDADQTEHDPTRDPVE